MIWTYDFCIAGKILIYLFLPQMRVESERCSNLKLSTLCPPCLPTFESCGSRLRFSFAAKRWGGDGTEGDCRRSKFGCPAQPASRPRAGIRIRSGANASIRIAAFGRERQPLLPPQQSGIRRQAQGFHGQSDGGDQGQHGHLPDDVWDDSGGGGGGRQRPWRR